MSTQFSADAPVERIPDEGIGSAPTPSSSDAGARQALLEPLEEQLAALEQLPAAEQLEQFVAIHAQLEQVLATGIDPTTSPR